MNEVQVINQYWLWLYMIWNTTFSCDHCCCCSDEYPHCCSVVQRLDFWVMIPLWFCKSYLLLYYFLCITDVSWHCNISSSIYGSYKFWVNSSKSRINEHINSNILWPSIFDFSQPHLSTINLLVMIPLWNYYVKNRLYKNDWYYLFFLLWTSCMCAMSNSVKLPFIERSSKRLIRLDFHAVHDIPGTFLFSTNQFNQIYIHFMKCVHLHTMAQNQHKGKFHSQNRIWHNGGINYQ